jgi:hypothetical protein
MHYTKLAASAALLLTISSSLEWQQAAGQEKHGKHVHILGSVHIRGLKVTVMPACAGAINPYGEPATKEIAGVVRVTIPENFDIGGMVDRNVRSNPVAGDETSEAPLDNGSTGTKIGEDGDPPFDIDLGDFGVEARFRQIRLVLMDKTRFTFYDKEGVEGVTAGDSIDAPTPNKLGLCGAHLYTPGDGLHSYPVAVFYVPMQARLGTGHYNYVLVPEKNPTLQLSVDPKVKNGGG